MIKKRRFSRIGKVRTAFFRGLMRNLILNKKIKTTEARAKAIRPRVEKLVTLAKKNNLASKRLLISRLSDLEISKKLEEIIKDYDKRAGGYLRIIKLNQRKSDGAKMAIIEFV